MKRREFIKTSLGATSLASVAAVTSTGLAAEKSQKSKQEFYEWRAYIEPQRKLVDDYLSKAAIPALNRLGIGPVGVFTDLDNPDNQSLYVLIPYPAIESFATVAASLQKDAEYLKAGADYINAPKSSPAYARIESSLMLAFAGMPKIELQPFSKQKKSRMFELRIYESHSEERGQKKVDMFNDGEIDVMREVTLGPVFFGQTLVGTKVPNMTYMLSAENRQAHQDHWKAFGAHPEWIRMRGLSEYADTVSRITNSFLAPAPYSQI